MTRKVLCLQSVHGRQPDHRPPRQIKSEVVMTNVDGPEIPVFIDEEIEHIYGMEYVGNDDGIGYVAISLILIRCKGEVTALHVRS
jgi:hypothetical protein